MKMGGLDYRGHCELFKPVPTPTEIERNTGAESAAWEAVNVNMVSVIRRLSGGFSASLWDGTDSFPSPGSLGNPCFQAFCGGGGGGASAVLNEHTESGNTDMLFTLPLYRPLVR